MYYRLFAILIPLYISVADVSAQVDRSHQYEQNCNTFGKTPGNPYTLCGTFMDSLKTGGECTFWVARNFCKDTLYESQFSYGTGPEAFFKFTCFQTGTLAFNITPYNPEFTFHWVLYDITNRKPLDIVDSTSCIVDYNFSYALGASGASPAGKDNFVCHSDGSVPLIFDGTPAYQVPIFASQPKFNKSSFIYSGHSYLLLVNEVIPKPKYYDPIFYSLRFTEGTAVILDPSLNKPGFTEVTSICKGNNISVKLNKPVKCSSIAKDGSDFKIFPGTIQPNSAYGYGCDASEMTDSIIIHLNRILQNGQYSLTQAVGSDGNTLLDYCKNAVPSGELKNFDNNAQLIADANFDYQSNYRCQPYSVQYQIQNLNPFASWVWLFDGVQDIRKEPIIVYKGAGNKNAKLIVTAGTCSDTVSALIPLREKSFKAAFQSTGFACPGDSIRFHDLSTGKIKSWIWDFGNGQTSNLQQPPLQYYPGATTSGFVKVSLTVMDTSSCLDTTYQQLRLVNNCTISVPSAFTPNGDGTNDYLYPLNAYKAINLHFTVFNRFGQKVFETREWTKKWNGPINDNLQPNGVYVWFLEYTVLETGARVFKKGTSMLIR